MILDVFNYRSDPSIVMIDDNCNDVLEPAEDFLVTVADGCVVRRDYLCNGVRNCDDCSDEAYLNCMAQDCTGCKLQSLKFFWHSRIFSQIIPPNLHVVYARCGTTSGQCIRRQYICDNFDDCINGWDESQCSSLLTNLTSGNIKRRMLINKYFEIPLFIVTMLSK